MSAAVVEPGRKSKCVLVTDSEILRRRGRKPDRYRPSLLFNNESFHSFRQQTYRNWSEVTVFFRYGNLVPLTSREIGKAYKWLV